MTRLAIKSSALVPLLCSMAAACPLCRDSAAIGPTAIGNPPASLFNASILWILAGLLLTAGCLIWNIAAAIRVSSRLH
jgi:hypothetical protein